MRDERDESFAVQVFEQIRKRVSYCLCVDDPMQYIEFAMDDLEVGHLGTTFFDIAWDLEYFMIEVDESQSLGSMITFTGSVDASWAATSRQYMEKMWPETGLTTLSAVEKALKPDEIGCSSNGDFGVEARRSYVKVQGSKWQAIEVAQQLAWMMSVFRTGKNRDSGREHYSHFEIEVQHTNRVSLSPLPLEEAPQSKAACWLPLLHGSVISYGFPIPERDDEVGVELSFNAIVPLAGIQYPVYTQDVTILRGWSTLLVPVKASPDFSSIQWHLLACEDPDDQRILRSLTSVSYVPNWRDVGLDSIKMSRSFVGYCSSANIHIGTKHFEPQSSEEKCGALVESSRMFWQKKVVVSMGTSGMGAFGFGAGGEIGFTKTAVASMAARQDFDKELDLSRRTPVMMYDLAKCTAWLVPEISVVLHMTLSWFLERQDLAQNEIKNLPFAPLSGDGGGAAMEAIANHKSLELKRSTGTSTWKFMDIVTDSVRLLKACRETKDRAQLSSSVSLWLSWVQSPRLCGWDMADMIEGRDYTLRKEIRVQKHLVEKWMSSIANHPQMLLLFCKNIDAPIRPVRPDQICRNWNPMPSGLDYLVASVQSLKDLARHCNGGDGGRKLTDKCYWSRPSGSNAWALCDYKSNKKCNRLQEIVDKNPNRPLRLPHSGAVVFGSFLGPRKKCRPLKVSSPEKGSVVADQPVGDTSTERPRSDSSSWYHHDGPEPLELANDDTDESLVPASSPSNETQQSGSFEEDCRAVFTALALRYDKHESSVDLDELIKDGRAIYNQCQQQTRALQRQKDLVDRMLMKLESISESI